MLVAVEEAFEFLAFERFAFLQRIDFSDEVELGFDDPFVIDGFEFVMKNAQRFMKRS